MDTGEAKREQGPARDRGRHSRALTPALLAGALGIVFGDIGTSPLYAFRECLSALGGPSVAPAEVLGILSLIVWSLILVVGLKYVTVVMRADNDGEGGIAALMALALPATPGPGRHRLLLAVGIVGIALFLGDGMITPAISVLSAVEGLSVATPAFEPYVVPSALGVLAVLFLAQSRGSGSIGRFFGPVMALWFAMLALSGLVEVAAHPQVLAALDPRHALHALTHGSAWKILDLLGAVFLALTGAEALYADMGHFGRGPIRIDWVVLVLPALALNYLGQGALVLADPSAAHGPFYAMVPHALLYPAIGLATAATVIASQAVISGAFTLVQQAALLGLLPRLRVRQTSASSIGQVYLPQVNLILALAVAALVAIFRSSNALSQAYGIAVVTTMLATTVLAASVASCRWGWGRARIALVFGPFAIIDLAFFAANLVKIPHGGWFPVGIGAVLCFLMVVWHRGRDRMLARIDEDAMSFEAFLADLEARRVPRVEGTGIYLTARRDQISPALLLNLRHNRVLHERVVLLNVEILRSASRPAATARLSVRTQPQGFVFATLRFGFMERPEILDALCRHPEILPLDPERTSFFVGREMPIASSGSGWRAWQAAIYAMLVRNAVRAPEYFRVPTKHTVELGTQVEL